MADVGSQLYEGTSSLGRFWTGFGLIVAIILSVIGVVTGTYLILHNQKDLVDTTGIVTTANCTPIYTKNGTNFSCVLGVKYIVNGKDYTGTITTTSQTPYFVGSTVTITYHTENPSDVRFHIIRNRTIGFIILGVCGVILLISWFNYWLARKFKFYAAAEGVGSTLNLFRSFQ